MTTNKSKITESLNDIDLWDRLDLHIGSYVISPLQLRYVSSKTGVIGRALRQAIPALLEYVRNKSSTYTEIDASVIGKEHRLSHSYESTLKIKDDELNENDKDDKIRFQISSIAPAIFSQIREDAGISNDDFQRSFTSHHLKDFTNPGKSGSLMYKTFDDLFILKTLRDYEARLLVEILSGYHLQLKQRCTLFNRYLGLYSIRLDTSISTIEIFIVVMANAFTPSLKINEIYDLKGSSIKRKCTGDLSIDKLYKLKDLDFMELYPHGIRIPSNIFEKLKTVVANDAKVLKKLNITDFSLILGISHLDMTDNEMIERRPMSCVGTLLHASKVLGLINLAQSHKGESLSPVIDEKDHSPMITPYLKPLEMLDEKLNMNVYYNNDPVAHASLPIPGIINKSNQRVYLYFVFVDMLQTYDHFKLLDQTFRKITDYNRRFEYSVIEPSEYEKRIKQFLFERVFINAQDDFPWAITDLSKLVAEIHPEEFQNVNINQPRSPQLRRSHSTDEQDSNSIIEFRL